MIRMAFFLFGIYLGFGCGGSMNKKDLSEHSTNGNKTESSIVYLSKEALWEHQFDTLNMDFQIVRSRNFISDTLTPQKIELIVNKTWPHVQIEIEKTDGDTIFLKIPDSEVLTQQMGTSGSESFLITTTFSFTELVQINYVSFEFEAGDNASPGIFARSDWSDK